MKTKQLIIGLPADRREQSWTFVEPFFTATLHPERPFILASDLRSALLDYQIPSDKALQQAFELDVKRNEGWAIPTTIPNLNAKSILQRRCTTVA